jgi:hypothetical protein
VKELHKALFKFWSQFEWGGKLIPAYPSGRVPQNEPFPYITFKVPQGAFFSATVTTAFVWCQADEDGTFNVQNQRAEILDAVARAIPEAGALLRFDGGSVVLRRNPSTFLEYYDPPSEGEETPTGEPVIGGRISYEMRFYIY